MAEISILLPSLRPEAVSRRVKEFSSTNGGVDYELIVISPFTVKGENVVHVQEVERKGVMHAITEGYKRVSGKYVVVWSDDASPEVDALRLMLDFVGREPAPFVAGFRLRDTRGKELEQWSVYGKLYVGWLCASKETIDLVGGLFDTSFKNYWADPDLSMRVWEKGGRAEVCRSAWITIEQINDHVKSENLRSSFDADTEVFFNKWHAKYGNGGKRVWTEINLPVPHSMGGHIRGFLRGVPGLKATKRFVLSLGGK